jgi:lysine-N-methylase
MAFPIQHLPVLQNWDCHVCGTCCKEYRVPITDAEKQRIEAQGWDKDKDLGGHELFQRVGMPWKRSYILNHRADDSCVFLSEEGRCRIHERFGYETKPLACRLFPFVLVPTGDHWSVGMRYACPSAAANKGRSIPEHDEALREFAAKLAERERLTIQPDGSLVPPPFFEGSGRVAWPEVLHIRDLLLDILRNRRDPMERRWRKCLALAAEARQARLDRLSSEQFVELFKIVRRKVETETPPNLMTLPEPAWMARMLFRQAVALYTRKYHGPNRGPAGRGRIAQAWAAYRFGRGKGPVPRTHNWLPETTFAEVEKPRGPWPMEVEAILERYYTLKVGALQFCGAASFGLPFWEGLEALAITFPVLAWVARMFNDGQREAAILKALSIVDDHFGFNRVLRTTRQRLSFRIIARSGELSRLIAWYSR